MQESYYSLKNQGKQPKVIGLLFYKTPWDEAPSNHFAVVLKEDAYDFVVDPTINQFYPLLPEEAIISTLDEWKALMINKEGCGKSSVVIMNIFDTPSLAKDVLAQPFDTKGRYFQSSLIKKYNVEFLKHGTNFENCLIADIDTITKKLKTLTNTLNKYSETGDPERFRAIKSLHTETKGDLDKLMALKSHFSIFSPDEIKVTHSIKSGFKKQILKYSVPTKDIKALRSTGDARGIISTFSGKSYIKIQKNAWVNVEQSEDSSFWITFQGQKKLLMRFDEMKEKWFFPALAAKA
ncbi:Dermonecrotoxin of the Papain-like fold [Izhakiella capsodis]|uniref:Dermonecrotoxin of the Papain-like fold n=1 Tax=Izhakiella capsodis TaxID=1367852 RepID=A0A1I4Z6I6_9GAMM|nr:hypothetical protein [Izhakiella capsodis]SFN45891.1 Dermonecrotoxin of the Papain-like fold [Izhakiella capsodis]